MSYDFLWFAVSIHDEMDKNIRMRHVQYFHWLYLLRCLVPVVSTLIEGLCALKCLENLTRCICLLGNEPSLANVEGVGVD